MSESATEVLRRMLDERGVEWWDSRYGEQVVFQVDGVKWFADDGCRDGMLELSTIAITPEQAIAATLGGGKLTADQVRDTVEKHWHDLPAEYDMPEATALPEYSYDWQAIADELNALIGGGECEVIQSDNGPKCSNCGKELPYDPYADYEGNFCATCGARIRKAVKR